MTPPKSVESVINQQPLSNQSQPTPNSMFPSTARTPSSTSNLITSNSNNILPPTYDDLNNIFEEDSADEQNSHQPAVLKEPTNLLNTFTTQPVIGPKEIIEPMNNISR